MLMGATGSPLKRGSVRIGTVAALSVIVAACGSTKQVETRSAHINNKTKFSVASYGVAASPRVTTSTKVKKGGGRYQIGKPYKVRGKWYTPKEEKNYDKVGMASWYGPNFHGRLTANGEVYDQYHLSAAHPTFPLPSYARVTNLTNGNSVMVRVNDRGPFAHGRIIDLSSKAADLLDFKKKGVAKVRVEYVGKARMDGLDMNFLLASYKGNRKVPRLSPSRPASPEVRMASVKTKPGNSLLQGLRTTPGKGLLAPVGRIPRAGIAATSRTVSATSRVVPQAASALVEAAPLSDALDAIVDLVLPDIGPVLIERPAVQPLLNPADGVSMTFTSAYVERRINGAFARFDQILSAKSQRGLKGLTK